MSSRHEIPKLKTARYEGVGVGRGDGGGGEKDGGKLNERAREPHSALGNKKLTNLIWVYEITHFNDSRRREYHGILVISGGGGGGGEKRTRVLRLHRTRQRAFQFERPILARIRFAVSADAV